VIRTAPDPIIEETENSFRQRRHGGSTWRRRLSFAAILLVCAVSFPLNAQEIPAAPLMPPSIQIEFGQAESPQQVSFALQLLVILTVLTLAPALLVMMTAFTRIIIVLGFLRQALATQQMPPNQVLIGMALLLTFFVMAPVFQQINEEAIQPYMEGEIEYQDAFNNALGPVRTFMLTQTRPADLELFAGLSRLPQRPQTNDDIPTYVLIPSFVTSELKTAFQIGFVIYVPFLIIDMVVASTLMSMGMLMLPPIFISLPFKIIMFVLADGWHLLMGALVRSFGPL